MKSRENHLTGETGTGDVTDGRVSRRDFLKMGAVAGAALGMGGTLGTALTACGSGSTDGGGSGSGGGREIKVGFVTPLTGPLASFGIPDAWCVKQWEASVKGGLKCGDGQTHPIKFIVKDTQSDTNRAAQVTGDLITNDGVDIVMAASTADTVPPVSDTCEAMQVPCVTNDCPWQAYFFGRGGDPNKGFQWTYHSWWGLEGITATFVSMWDSLKTNKKVAEMWPNDGDGLAWANDKTGQPPVLTKGGYTIVDGGRYQDLTDDYSAQIAKFKGADAQILSGVMLPPDFTNFWKQSLQQDFNPIVATVGKALLFPQSLEALGNIGYNLSSECWWSPNHPFKSSLTGQTCKELADQYETDNDAQWTQPILHYAIFEVVADALKRTTSVDDKAAIRDAVKATDMQTIGGHITWSSSDKKLNPVPNVCTTPITGGQWVKGTSHPFEVVVVSNSVAPEVPLGGELKPLAY
ncbi:MAG TPA: ABC transporter substrate-binding protein [Thermoleophilia bacterium]|nr:ABC transporter substrate-binding protein [Thermoleophilia bacterium]